MSYNQRDLRKVWIPYDTEQPEEEVEYHVDEGKISYMYPESPRSSKQRLCLKRQG